MSVITSTGSNFGNNSVQLNYLGEDTYIILTGLVTIDPTSAEYQAASTLEIYFPALSIKNSAVTGVAMLAAGSLPRRGVYVKTWIKNNTTLCVEKLGIFDDSGSMDLYFATCYAAIGSRPPFSEMQEYFLGAITKGGIQVYANNFAGGVSDKYYYYGSTFNSFHGVAAGETWEYTCSAKNIVPVVVPLMMAVTDATKIGNDFFLLEFGGKKCVVNNYPYCGDEPECGFAFFAILEDAA